MDEDATWYERRPQPRPHYVRRGPSSPLRKGHSTFPPLAHVYCDHGRPSQLLLSSCRNCRPETLCCIRVKFSPYILALLFDLPSVLRDNSLSITVHFQTETETHQFGQRQTSFGAAVAFLDFFVKFDAVVQEKCPKSYDKYSAVVFPK